MVFWLYKCACCCRSVMTFAHRLNSTHFASHFATHEIILKSDWNSMQRHSTVWDNVCVFTAIECHNRHHSIRENRQGNKWFLACNNFCFVWRIFSFFFLVKICKFFCWIDQKIVSCSIKGEFIWSFEKKIAVFCGTKIVSIFSAWFFLFGSKWLDKMFLTQWNDHFKIDFKVFFFCLIQKLIEEIHSRKVDASLSFKLVHSTCTWFGSYNTFEVWFRVF